MRRLRRLISKPGTPTSAPASCPRGAPSGRHPQLRKVVTKALPSRSMMAVMKHTHRQFGETSPRLRKRAASARGRTRATPPSTHGPGSLWRATRHPSPFTEVRALLQADARGACGGARGSNSPPSCLHHGSHEAEQQHCSRGIETPLARGATPPRRPSMPTLGDTLTRVHAGGRTAAGRRPSAGPRKWLTTALRARSIMSLMKQENRQSRVVPAWCAKRRRSPQNRSPERAQKSPQFAPLSRPRMGLMRRTCRLQKVSRYSTHLELHHDPMREKTRQRQGAQKVPLRGMIRPQGALMKVRAQRRSPVHAFRA